MNEDTEALAASEPLPHRGWEAVMSEADEWVAIREHFRRETERQANVYAESSQRLRDDLALSHRARADQEEFIAELRGRLSHVEAERDEAQAQLARTLAKQAAHIEPVTLDPRATT